MENGNDNNTGQKISDELERLLSGFVLPKRVWDKNQLTPAREALDAINEKERDVVLQHLKDIGEGCNCHPLFVFLAFAEHTAGEKTSWFLRKISSSKSLLGTIQNLPRH